MQVLDVFMQIQIFSMEFRLRVQTMVARILVDDDDSSCTKIEQILYLNAQIMTNFSFLGMNNYALFTFLSSHYVNPFTHSA